MNKPSQRRNKPGERHISNPGTSPSKIHDSPNPGNARLICASAQLPEGGDGVRFELDWEGELVPAFAIRHRGNAYAYLNRCAHIAMELDWKPGKFFDAQREYLICSTHGAWYVPQSGVCRGGPCRGAALTRLNVFESDGKVYVMKTKG